MLWNARESAADNFVRTPRSSSARTPGGITPSPHALSATPSLRSNTATESPRRAASMATARPAGPAPTTATSSAPSPTEEPRHEPRAIAERLGVGGAERALLLSNSNRKNDRVACRECGSRQVGAVHERNARELDGDGEVIRMP